MKKVLLFKLLVVGALVVGGCSDKHNGDSSNYGLLGDDNTTVTVGDGSKDGNSSVNDDGTKSGNSDANSTNGDNNSTNGNGDDNATSGDNNGTNSNGGADSNTTGDNGGADGNTTGGGNSNSDDTNATVTIPKDMKTALSRNIIPYNRITLAIKSTSVARVIAINKTLLDKQNRDIKIKGVNNSGVFYLYNIPLIDGKNIILLKATTYANKTIDKNITINAKIEKNIPIGMRASKYEGIKHLDTNIEVGVGLKAVEYLFDKEADGKIDIEQKDGNFTLHLTKEGRYKPRVTVKTEKGLLYSSDYYALSLDVKANANQKDPKGAEPIDVAKAFKEAVLAGDFMEIEKLTGGNQKILYMLFKNKKGLLLLQDIYKHANEFEEKKWKMDGRTSIVYTFKKDGVVYSGGLEMKLISSQINTGRQWIVDFIY